MNFCYVQIKKAAQKRKEEDADFEEKRMILGITAEGDEDENDKENLVRRREMIRSRLEKEPVMFFGQEEEDIRHRRGGDIVSRWRDKRDSSPVLYRVSQIPSQYYSDLLCSSVSNCSRGLLLSLVFHCMLSSIVRHGVAEEQSESVFLVIMLEFWNVIFITPYIWLPLLFGICLLPF